MIDRSELDVVTTFGGVPELELEWIAEHSEVRELEAGEQFYRQGEPSDALHVILSGRLQLVRYDGSKEEASFIGEAGQVSGLLPFSRMKTHGVTATALIATRIAILSADRFPEFATSAPTILERLIHQMLDRTQVYTRLGAQREKLISLGTMSAGLAHELNNPAAAAKACSAEPSGDPAGLR